MALRPEGYLRRRMGHSHVYRCRGGRDRNHPVYDRTQRRRIKLQALHRCRANQQLGRYYRQCELTGTGNANITVYGQITAGQVVPPGTYTDTMSTATTTFPVTVVIAATCSISATNLAFGTYSGALINATSTVTTNCTNLCPIQHRPQRGDTQPERPLPPGR